MKFGGLGALGTIGGSGGVSPVAGPATHFTVTAPSSAVTGTPISVTVVALDASNNLATSYAGTVHFTSSDGAAALPANSTLTSGIRTFSVTLNTSGTQTITATDTVTGTINGTSGPIVVTAAVVTNNLTTEDLSQNLTTEDLSQILVTETAPVGFQPTFLILRILKMANLTSVGIVAGVPNSGTGTVSTIDALMAQLAGGQPISGTVGCTQSTSPWVISGTVVQGAPGSTPWLAKLSDGTNLATIKAASTTPVIGDTQIVVGIHPNSLNANGAKVGAASAPVVLNTDAATIAVAYDTTQLMNGLSGAGLTPTKARINTTTSGVTTMVAATAGKKIRVLAMYINSAVANVINLQSHVTTANNDGALAYSATGGMVLPFNPIGWFDTTVGEALDINIASTGQVSGQFSYILV